jgi:ketosteroid isomerase-like protein
MKFTRLFSVAACGVVRFLAAFVLFLVLPHAALAQIAEDGGDMKDRIAIQEKLLYAYAYAYDSKDCVRWANLFTTDAILDLGADMKATGRDAILQVCVARQKNVVGNIKTRHNMTNIVFDQLTANQAKTRTYLVLTWQKPGETPTIQSAFTYRDVIVKQDDGRWLFKERHFDR